MTGHYRALNRLNTRCDSDKFLDRTLVTSDIS